MTDDLERLRAFVTVADLLSFTRAAERLHTSQSPLSRRIRSLEADVGARLFDRTTREVRLTLAGQVLYEQATALLDGYVSALDATRGVAEGAAGSLSLGFGEAWHAIVPPLIALFSREHPAVTLRLHTGLTTTAHIEMLQSRRVDVGVIPLPGQLRPKGLRLIDIGEFAPLIAVPSGHALAARERVVPAELAGVRFIDYPQSSMPIVHATLRSLARLGGFEPDVVLTSDGVRTHLELVTADVGASVVPALAVPPGGVQGVSLLAIDAPQLSSRSALAYSEINRNPLIPVYVETVLRVLREHVGEGAGG